MADGSLPEGVPLEGLEAEGYRVGDVLVAPGARIRLVHTDDPYTALRPGDEGTVTRVSAVLGDASIDVAWDSGSTLSLIPASGDRFTVLGAT